MVEQGWAEGCHVLVGEAARVCTASEWHRQRDADDDETSLQAHNSNNKSAPLDFALSGNDGIGHASKNVLPSPAQKNADL